MSTSLENALAVQGVSAATFDAAFAGLQPLPRPGGGILTTKNILDPGGTNPALFGIADVYAGTITLPYYVPTPAQATTANPAPPLTGQFQSAAPFSLIPGVNCSATPTPASCSTAPARSPPPRGR